MDREVFVDTSYAIALANASDQFHAKAALLARQLRTHKTKLITTRGVLLEIGNALSSQRFRSAAVQLFDALTSALTTDMHFQQAGFRVLLRE